MKQRGPVCGITRKSEKWCDWPQVTQLKQSETELKFSYATLSIVSTVSKFLISIHLLVWYKATSSLTFSFLHFWKVSLKSRSGVY